MAPVSHKIGSLATSDLSDALGRRLTPGMRGSVSTAHQGRYTSLTPALHQVCVSRTKFPTQTVGIIRAFQWKRFQRESWSKHHP